MPLSVELPVIVQLRAISKILIFFRTYANSTHSWHGQIFTEGNQRSYPLSGNPPVALAPPANCPLSIAVQQIKLLGK
ncbi:MAG: hypothetical protein PUP91_14645 [Rhizonema sp. PD37]|nr:hypothetical protein [Rhizonema sp. PD37]